MNATASPFHQHLRRIEAAGAPLPLSSSEATDRAVLLRAHGLTYANIAVVMRLYHGQSRTGEAWRVRCRRAGSPPVFHGVPFPRQEAETR